MRLYSMGTHRGMNLKKEEVESVGHPFIIEIPSDTNQLSDKTYRSIVTRVREEYATAELVSVGQPTIKGASSFIPLQAYKFRQRGRETGAPR